MKYSYGPKHTLPPLPLFRTLTIGLNSGKGLEENPTMSSCIGTPFSLSLSTIWITKNNNLFNNKGDHVPTKDLIALAPEFELLNKETNSPIGPLSYTLLKSRVPKRGKAKDKIEKLIKNNPRPRGVGGVYRNNNVQWTLGFLKIGPLRTPSMVELQALHKSLLLIRNHYLTSLEIYQDPSWAPARNKHSE